MAMPVTPGYGAAVATANKGGAHHQHVIIHDDRLRQFVVPAITPNVPYPDNTYLGGEIIIQNATRFSGDNTMVESATVVLRNQDDPVDFDVLFFAEPMKVVPSDGVVPFIQPDEVGNLLGVLQVRASSFAPLGAHMIAPVAPVAPVIISSGTGVVSVRMVLVARGEHSYVAADTIGITLNLKRD